MTFKNKSKTEEIRKTLQAKLLENFSFTTKKKRNKQRKLKTNYR